MEKKSFVKFPSGRYQIPTITDAKLWVDESEFIEFKNDFNTTEGWVEESRHERHALAICSSKASIDGISRLKLTATFPDVLPIAVADCLLDPEYTSQRDPQFLEWKFVESMTPYNEIFYYASKVPPPLTNRDWVLQSIWKYSGSDIIGIARSVEHPAFPPNTGDRIRATTYISGFWLSPTDDGKGCKFRYMLHTNMNGWTPKWIINQASKTMGPEMVNTLYESGKKYEEWKSQHQSHLRPWRDGHYRT